jgi:hypothetical protein
MTVAEAGSDGAALGHTNHILDDAFAAANPSQSEPIDGNGRRRLDTALRRSREGGSIEQILADRSPAGAVCQCGEDGLHTDFAVLFEPAEARMTLWPGAPVDVQPIEYDLGRLLT